MKRVTALSIMQARYRVPLEAAGPGNWVLIEGIDASISKTATVVSEPSPVRRRRLLRCPLICQQTQVSPLASPQPRRD